jgi:gas vesicle protein
MKNKENFILGLFAGATIGAAVGMLFSPHKGTVLRRAIRRKGEDIADGVTENIEDRIGQFGDTVTEKIEMLKDDLKSKYSTARESINRR